jgi:glyoxylase-like metal-dependent hydrolase (beta-lactamase superfamily II)
MTYTGEVEVGGPAATQEAGDLVITKVAVGEMSNNAYLLRCALTGEQVLIDAAAEPDTLLELIGEAGGGAGPRAADGQSLARVVTTHWHPDHWQALAAVVDATGAETVASGIDAEHIPVPTTAPVSDGARVRVGSCELEVIHLSGHTDGSIALAYDDPDGVVHLFTGDSLFPGGVGKTWSPEDFARLIDDVETKLFGRFGDDTWFYPGHGNDSTLGAERPALAEWRERGW